jgi:hypothetical protein
MTATAGTAQVAASVGEVDLTAGTLLDGNAADIDLDASASVEINGGTSAALTGATTASLTAVAGAVTVSSTNSTAALAADTGVSITSTENDLACYVGSAVYAGASASKRIVLWPADGDWPMKSVFLPAMMSGLGSHVAGETAATASSTACFPGSILTSGDSMLWVWAVPEELNIAPTTSVTVIIHWATANADADEWQATVAVRAVADGENTSSGGTAQTIDTGDMAGTGANLLKKSTVGTFTASPANRDLVSIQLKRVAVDSGTEIDHAGAGDEPVVIGIELRYQVDKIGE